MKWVTAAMQRAVNASPRDRHRRCNSFHLDQLLSIADWRNSNAAGSDPVVPGASPGSAATFSGCSSGAEHSAGGRAAAGANPVIPTTIFRRVAQPGRAPARHAGGLRCNPGRDDQWRTNRSRNGTGLNPDRRARPAGERDLCSPPFLPPRRSQRRISLVSGRGGCICLRWLHCFTGL